MSNVSSGGWRQAVNGTTPCPGFGVIASSIPNDRRPVARTATASSATSAPTASASPQHRQAAANTGGIGPSAERVRGEERSVGLDQYLIHRDGTAAASRKVGALREGDHSRERQDISGLDAAAREIAASPENAWNTTCRRRALVPRRIAQHVLVGVAIVDHQRLVGRSLGQRDVPPKVLPLQLRARCGPSSSPGPSRRSRPPAGSAASRSASSS